MSQFRSFNASIEMAGERAANHVAHDDGVVACSKNCCATLESGDLTGAEWPQSYRRPFGRLAKKRAANFAFDVVEGDHGEAVKQQAGEIFSSSSGLRETFETGQI